MEQNETYNRILEHALKYAENGLAVFPCAPRGKRPLENGWQSTATTDPETIKSKWSQNPRASIGIATGSTSGGLIVVDVDNHDVDGAESLRQWEAENGKLPETATVLTGGGGVHYYYRSKEPVRGRAGVIPGVDIRADGNLIIAPPSIHPNGKSYEWDLGADLDDPGIAEANAVVMKLVKFGTEKKTSEAAYKLPDVIRNGNRDTELFHYACSLQAKGMDDLGILGAVKEANLQRCTEPLPDDEIKRMVDSAKKYQKGGRGLITIKGKVRQCAENVLTVLEKDFNGHIMYNEFAKQVEWFGPLPWNPDPLSGEWTDWDDSELKSYLDINYDLTKEQAYTDGFNMCIRRHTYNPVTGWFEALEPWDGKPHIENLLPRYTGAKKSEYNTAVMRTVMLGAISRAFEPGCKFDYVFVLVGEQGKYKSTFLQHLAVNDDWYDGNFSTIDGDKAVEKLRGRWILEMAELLAVKKQKENEGVKAFITTTEDSYRAPYERRTKHVKRMCIFCATTNDFQFMSDRTGNRRYLPVKVNETPVPKDKDLFADPEATAAEFRQAWAEAYHIYKTEHPPLIMPPELMAQVLDEQGRYMQDDPDIGIIQDYLDRKQGRVCSKMIWDEALDREHIPGRPQDWKKITMIMDNSITGWHKLPNRVRCGKYGIQACYEPDKDRLVDVPENEQIPF